MIVRAVVSLGISHRDAKGEIIIDFEDEVEATEVALTWTEQDPLHGDYPHFAEVWTPGGGLSRYTTVPRERKCTCHCR